MSWKLTFCSGREINLWISNITLRPFGVRIFSSESIDLNINVWARLSSSKWLDIQSLFLTACDPSLLRDGFVSQIANISELNFRLIKPIEQSPVKTKQQKMTRYGFLAMNLPSCSKPFSKSWMTLILMTKYYRKKTSQHLINQKIVTCLCCKSSCVWMFMHFSLYFF